MDKISQQQPLVTLADVQAARALIRDSVHLTPVLSSTSITKMTQHEFLVFKCENLQRTGSFKIRGASHAVARAKQERRGEVKDFVTHSSGNHGQALALAAAAAGCRAHVVVPRNAPSVKSDAVRGYGGVVTFCEPNLAARESSCKTLLSSIPNSVFVHPFDNPWIIAGQGTIGLELMEQTNSELDAVVVPVGGGGLLSGIATAVKGIKPSIKVVAAEPLGADDTARSFAAQQRVPSHRNALPNTIADGLLTLNSDFTFAHILARVDHVVAVSEEEIRAAMAVVFSRLKIVIEPSAAVGVAVVLRKPPELAGMRRVAVVLCGGNVEVEKISTFCKL